jgi:hypothetical protein
MEVTVFHLGDKVQVIATGRPGKLEECRNSGELWRVSFSDGGKPPIDYFKPEALRLVECPHPEPEPGFVPERGIME